MFNCLYFALVCFIILSVQVMSQGQGSSTYQRVHFGYYTQWSIYDRNYQIENIPIQHYTHLLYAFTGVSPGPNYTLTLLDKWADVGLAANGTELGGNFIKLQKLKQSNPSLKVLISVGGWFHSGLFSDMASQEAGRNSFANSCAALLNKYGFDGIDIDWEYPVDGGNKIPHRPEDKQNYVLLMQALRKALGPNKLITAALPASPNFAKNYDLPAISSILDYINLMESDFAGPWSSRTDHQANLHAGSSSGRSAETSIQFYLDNGAPANKLVLGYPAYGRGWSGVPDVNYGLNQTFKSIPNGTWEAGVFDYKDIKNRLILGGTCFTVDDETKGASFVYCPSWNNGTFISYDSPDVVKWKGKFVCDKKLAGMMVWSIDRDDGDLANAAKGSIECSVPTPTPAPEPIQPTNPPYPPRPVPINVNGQSSASASASAHAVENVDVDIL